MKNKDKEDGIMQFMHSILKEYPEHKSKQILSVLSHGREKHGERPLASPESHLAHAQSHLANERRDPGGVDEDSGEPHLAHVETRCLLALYAVKQCFDFKK